MAKKKKPSLLLKWRAKPLSKLAKLQLMPAKLLKKRLPLLTKPLLLLAKLPPLLTKPLLPLAKRLMLLLLLLPPSNYWPRNNQPAFGPVFSSESRGAVSASEEGIEPRDSFSQPR